MCAYSAPSSNLWPQSLNKIIRNTARRGNTQPELSTSQTPVCHQDSRLAGVLQVARTHHPHQILYTFQANHA